MLMRCAAWHHITPPRVCVPLPRVCVPRTHPICVCARPGAPLPHAHTPHTHLCATLPTHRAARLSLCGSPTSRTSERSGRLPRRRLAPPPQMKGGYQIYANLLKDQASHTSTSMVGIYVMHVIAYGRPRMGCHRPPRTPTTCHPRAHSAPPRTPTTSGVLTALTRLTALARLTALTRPALTRLDCLSPPDRLDPPRLDPP
jgi:hypothetical protein